MATQNDSKPEREGIRIPTALVGLITTLMVQSGVGIWWAATQTAKMDTVVAQMEGLKTSIEKDRAERFSMKDANDLLSRMVDHEARLRDLERGKRP